MVMSCGHSDAHLRSSGDYVGSKSILDVLWHAVGNEEPCPWEEVTFYCARCEADARRWEDTRYLRGRNRLRKLSQSLT